MRRIISIQDPGFNNKTYEMNIAIATLESPIFYSKEVDGIPNVFSSTISALYFSSFKLYLDHYERISD